ncbi:MAG: NADPH:quinone reductase [Micrococcaceae bacterium]|jgi:NADPH2:quinone reductase|nr:NADPH:quinone reductase [Micrococcaceae bacterium]
MSKAIILHKQGGPEVLTLSDVEQPTPKAGQLLLKVVATGVNYVETYQRNGTYSVPLPFTPGAEAAGVVAAVGPGVESFEVGQRVATAEATGTYAEYALVDEGKALPVPDEVSDDVAAALPLQGMTAHYLLNSCYRVEPGQTVLTHAGAGGVGLLLIQLLKERGAKVLTTVSSDAKAELARGAGADQVLRYADFASTVRDLTDGTGVDVVFDGVGKDTFDGSLASLRTRGMLVLFGAASGPVPPFDPQRLNAAGSVYLTRPTLNHFLQNPQERRWRAEELFSAVAKGKLNVRIGARYALADAAQAHTDLQARKTTGKVLLVP